MNKPILPLVSYITLAMTFALMVVVGFWCLYPYKPIVFKDKVFPVINKTVKQGSYLQYTSEYTKNNDLPAMISRSFVNDLVFVTSPTVSNNSVGDNKFTVSIKVPNELPAGRYFLKTLYTYKVNPLREITVREDTEEFTVVE